MESDYSQSISKYLQRLVPLSPQATSAEVKLEPKTDIQAVIFDIYGTLLISASGDIDQAEVRTVFIDNALVGTEITVPDGFSAKAFSLYKAEIKRQHSAAHKQGVAHPEIDVISVWTQVFFANGISADKEQVASFAFIFELQSNPVYPMPDMAPVLAGLAEKNIPLGIVSNAQFYTIPILNYFIRGIDGLADSLPYFTASLCSFSFEERIAKPDFRLFKKVSRQLKEQYGIEAQQTLYVGNDMFRDIYPAQKTGFKTVLYAGDSRSLRLRPEHKNVVGIVPDYIINNLNQLADIMH